MQALLDSAIDIAREAGKYIIDSVEDLKNVDYKGRTDMVTDVDRGSEELIMKRIQERYPDHVIMAEESGGKNADHSIRWIIDPIDGTTNFIHGYRNFCVSIAIQRNEETVAAVVYNPGTDEMYSALEHQGARLNGQSIQVSTVSTLSESMVSTGFPEKWNDHWHRSFDLFKLFYYRTHAVRRDGSAALDLCYVAAGRFEGFWEYDLYPWDVAAGLLIVREAGGKTTDFKNNISSIHDKQIVASNELIHEAMIKMLQILPGDEELE